MAAEVWLAEILLAMADLPKRLNPLRVRVHSKKDGVRDKKHRADMVSFAAGCARIFGCDSRGTRHLIAEYKLSRYYVFVTEPETNKQTRKRLGMTTKGK